MCPTLTVGSFFRHERSIFLFICSVRPKHTANHRTPPSKIIKPTSRTLKTTKDPRFGYLGVFNLDFFLHYEAFFKNFLIVPMETPFIFFDVMEHNRCLKILKGLPFRFFGTMRLFKIVMFHLTLGFLNTYPPKFFSILSEI